MNNSLNKDLEDLKKKVDSISVWDYPARDDVIRRAIFYAIRAFGAESNFISEIRDVEFEGIAVAVSGGPPGPSSYDKKEWEDGKRDLKNILDLMIEELREQNRGVQEELESSPIQSNRIFVVHGHDNAMKESVARTISRLGLEPIILHEQPDRGRTIIEKFKEEGSDTRFVVVLLSPDDEGRKKGEKLRPRARQNVVFELGFFYGKLGRDRVVALYKEEEDFEQPSDITGIIYVPYDDHGAWKMRLYRELKACGYDVSADKLLFS